MSGALAPWKRQRETSRIENFSDAVFAFAATLLVVSLEVPQTFAELAADLHGFVAFGLSFTALIVIWHAHTVHFRDFGRTDAVTVILNSLLLFVVLFYVYPLKFVARGIAVGVLGFDSNGGGSPMVADSQELAALFMLYSFGFAILFLCFALLYGYAYVRRASYGLSPTDGARAVFYVRHFLIFTAVGAASFLLAWQRIGLTSGMPGWVYFALGPLCALHGFLSDRGRGRSPAADESERDEQA